MTKAENYYVEMKTALVRIGKIYGSVEGQHSLATKGSIEWKGDKAFAGLYLLNLCKPYGDVKIVLRGENSERVFTAKSFIEAWVKAYDFQRRLAMFNLDTAALTRERFIDGPPGKPAESEIGTEKEVTGNAPCDEHPGQ